MWKKRIVWLLIIIMAAVLYLMANETVTMAVLFVTILIPAFSAMFMMLAGRRFNVNVLVGDGPKVDVKIDGGGGIGAANLDLAFRSRNIRTGRTDTIPLNAYVGRKGALIKDVATDMNHAGVYELSCDCLHITDALGMFSRKVQGSCVNETSVKADEFDTEVFLSTSSAVMLESDKYSNDRGGNDPGEVRGIREYVIGDQIKNIHWKLSEKNDKLLVKELSLPVTEQVLIVIDTLKADNVTEGGLDAIASIFVSVMRALEKLEINFSAGWLSAGGLVIKEIGSDDDIGAVMEGVLAEPPSGESIADKMLRGNMKRRVAHLVYVGMKTPSGIDELLSGCKVTAFVYGQKGSSISQSGTVSIGFDEYSYKELLTEIEV